jgi:hypothetical protein
MTGFCGDTDRIRTYDLGFRSLLLHHKTEYVDQICAPCVVARIGFEPMTLGLEVPCSIQLSYRAKAQGAQI